jgi:hypothetical protein
MLNLNMLPDESPARIVRVDPRPLGDDTGGLRWDVDLAFELSSPEDILKADAVINGANFLVTRAEEAGTRATLNDKTKRPDVRLSLAAHGERIVDDVNAEIRFTRLEVNGKVAVATVRVRLRGSAESRIGLLTNYGESVDCIMGATQLELPFDGSDERVINAGDLVQLKAASNCACKVGMVQLTTEDALTITDIGANAFNVSRDDVESVLRIDVASNTTLAKQIASYKRRSSRKNIEPAWESIVEALKQVISEGCETSETGAWLITDDVIDIAVAHDINLNNNSSAEAL